MFVDPSKFHQDRKTPVTQISRLCILEQPPPNKVLSFRNNIRKMYSLMLPTYHLQILDRYSGAFSSHYNIYDVGKYKISEQVLQVFQKMKKGSWRFARRLPLFTYLIICCIVMLRHISRIIISHHNLLWYSMFSRQDDQCMKLVNYDLTSYAIIHSYLQLYLLKKVTQRFNK